MQWCIKNKECLGVHNALCINRSRYRNVSQVFISVHRPLSLFLSLSFLLLSLSIYIYTYICLSVCLSLYIYIYVYIYRHKKWTWRPAFKSKTRLLSFHWALIPLGKVTIQLFSARHRWKIGQSGLFNFGMATDVRKWKIWNQSSYISLFRLKIEIVLHSAFGEWLANYIYIYI